MLSVIASSKATKQSSFFMACGLLRGACHRARIRATRWLAMTVSAPERRLRIAPGDEFRHDKASLSLTELQLGAVRVRDPAPGRGDARMPRRDVPFGCGGEAGIDIGAALRDPAEFDR